VVVCGAVGRKSPEPVVVVERRVPGSSMVVVRCVLEPAVPGCRVVVVEEQAEMAGSNLQRGVLWW